MAANSPIVFSIDGQEVVLVSCNTMRERGVVDSAGEKIGRPIQYAEISVTLLEDGDDPSEPTGEDREYMVMVSSEDAGLLSRSRQREEIDSDPEGAIEKIGAKNLIQWALGREAGPGDIKVSSLTEWLDLFLENPAEDLNGYDSMEADVREVGVEDQEQRELLGISSWQRLQELLEFVPDVAYRQN